MRFIYLLAEGFLFPGILLVNTHKIKGYDGREKQTEYSQRYPGINDLFGSRLQEMNKENTFKNICKIGYRHEDHEFLVILPGKKYDQKTQEDRHIRYALSLPPVIAKDTEHNDHVKV